MKRLDLPEFRPREWVSRNAVVDKTGIRQRLWGKPTAKIICMLFDFMNRTDPKLAQMLYEEYMKCDD